MSEGCWPFMQPWKRPRALSCPGWRERCENDNWTQAKGTAYSSCYLLGHVSTGYEQVFSKLRLSCEGPAGW